MSFGGRILASFLLVSVLSKSAGLEVGGDFRGALDRSLTRLAEESWTARAARLGTFAEPAAIRERQAFIRRWLTEAIGGLPARTPLNARITGILEREGYRIEKLVFESLPGLFVTANLYVPAGGSRPFPAVVGVAGHSDTGKAIGTYQFAWIGMVRRGFVVLAFDPPGQGERLEYLNPATGKSSVGVGVPEHIMTGLQCLLTGTTFARYEAWDGIRAVDYLLTRPEVDPTRIAVAGNSGGGTQAAYLAVLEPRLSAAVTSCYITSWRTLWSDPGPQDSEQVFPNFLRDGLDFGDFLLAFAPKPVLMTTAIRDFFPIAGARATYAEVDRLFNVGDAPGRAGYFEFDDEHGWSKPRREAAYRWLAKWLQSREDDGAEPEIIIEDPKTLTVTPTGQVATSFRGRTTRQINAELAAELFEHRTAARSAPDQLRSAIRDRLRIPAVAGEVRAEQVGAAEERSGYRLEKLRIRSADGLEVPAFLARPAKGASGSGVVWVDSAGKAAALDEIERRVRAGAVVLALDPAAIGESAVQSTGRGYTPEYQLAMKSLLVGRPVFGMQVADVLAGAAYLRTVADVKEVRLEGHGAAGLAALAAGALDPTIAAVSLSAAPLSWMDLVRADTHKASAYLFVAGLLKDFDAPDLAALVAPRPLRISGARSASGNPLPTEKVLKEFQTASQAYKRFAASEALQITPDEAVLKAQ